MAYLASYELDSNDWQTVLAFDTYQSAEQKMIFHSQGRRWVIVHESQGWILDELGIEHPKS